MNDSFLQFSKESVLWLILFNDSAKPVCHLQDAKVYRVNSFENTVNSHNTENIINNIMFLTFFHIWNKEEQNMP